VRFDETIIAGVNWLPWLWRKLPFEGLGDCDLGMIVLWILLPTEVLERMKFASEDGFTMNAEDTLTTLGGCSSPVSMMSL
jgi:hypothetical protein